MGNAIFAQLPLLVARLPEGQALGTQLSMMAQAGAKRSEDGGSSFLVRGEGGGGEGLKYVENQWFGGWGVLGKVFKYGFTMTPAELSDQSSKWHFGLFATKSP